MVSVGPDCARPARGSASAASRNRQPHTNLGVGTPRRAQADAGRRRPAAEEVGWDQAGTAAAGFVGVLRRTTLKVEGRRLRRTAFTTRHRVDLRRCAERGADQRHALPLISVEGREIIIKSGAARRARRETGWGGGKINAAPPFFQLLQGDAWWQG